MSIQDADLARAFASEARGDFEGVFWVDARGGSLASVGGELASQLGLRLPGELHTNLCAIREVCSQYRCLVVMEGAGPAVASALDPLGRSSLLLVPGPPLQLSTASVIAQVQALSNWVTEAVHIPHSGHLLASLEWLIAQPSQWSLACQLGRAAIAYYKFHDRFAEAFELIEPLIAEAVKRHDRSPAWEFGKERGWILDMWGRGMESVQPFTLHQDSSVQLALW